ncbi:hypothetical protein [Mycobacterium servetii]|uniref:Uncharacterized protein n=1 Tax=Mycobacterium servetii TaxID=3237418 RepID=A0ABV4C0S4_9MYCO
MPNDTGVTPWVAASIRAGEMRSALPAPVLNGASAAGNVRDGAEPDEQATTVASTVAAATGHPALRPTRMAYQEKLSSK